jgi:itaconate CoA-transferase
VAQAGRESDVPFLKGIRVLAFENGLAGPLCSRLLRDLGADVVKVERPESGDITRTWDTTARGLSSGFIWVNRGKRSVALDVKDPGERGTLERLVARSDVVLQNFTPGWADRVKLDEGSVRALRPDIVYIEISGYGPGGPYARRNAYDLVMQGEAGLISLTGSEEQPARIGVSICDLAAGSYAATATLAALVRRERTGDGAHVSVSLFDTMVDWLGYFPHLFWHRSSTPTRTGMRHPHFLPYGPYKASDGRLVGVAVLSAEHWRRLCNDVLERPELLAERRYATNEDRVTHRAELEPLLEKAFALRSASEWFARLETASIPYGAVNDLSDVMKHPQLVHNRLVTQVESSVGAIPAIGNPFLLGGRRPDVGPVPELGEHTSEVLRELDSDGVL